MGKRKVTSMDIAKAAGVSQSTVSMVLNKKYNVSFSKETVEKVERVAKELGYVPQKRKHRKESKKEKLLVVFCSNLTNPYYVMLLQGIESRAKEQGFGLFVCNTQRDLHMEERYLKMMWELKPLGIIYTCNPSHCFMELVEELSRSIPVAIINNQNERLNVDAVELDNSKLGRMMAEHLLELEAKLKVPGDMSVMGCDNTLFARMHKVDLTTIEHFVIFKGRDACDIIMKKIASHNTKYSDIEPISTYHVEYEPKLIVRGTTSYPREIKRRRR